MDLGSHTVVADAFVLPLTETLVAELRPSLGAISVLKQIRISDQEAVAWKYLIPAFAERCRNWEHKTNCAYIQLGMIPISTQHGETPICDCGKGKVNPSFSRNAQWTAFAPYVTRIAISPLFAVSCLEPVGRVLPRSGDVHEERTGGAGQSVASDAAEAYQCDNCKTSLVEGQALKCSACRTATYCSRECQKSDWKKHKTECKKV